MHTHTHSKVQISTNPPPTPFRSASTPIAALLDGARPCSLPHHINQLQLFNPRDSEPYILCHAISIPGQRGHVDELITPGRPSVLHAAEILFLLSLGLNWAWNVEEYYLHVQDPSTTYGGRGSLFLLPPLPQPPPPPPPLADNITHPGLHALSITFVRLVKIPRESKARVE